MSAERAFASWEAAVEWLRRQPDQSRLIADCYFDDPLVGAAERYWGSEEWRAVRKQLGVAAGKALDVGAGRGIASYALAREGFEVTAVEPDPSELVGAGAIRALADEAGLPIQVVEEFSERLPFADGAFDVVFARAVLHHTRALQTACSEFFRVLRPGGRLIAVREHVISRRRDLAAFLAQHPLHNLYGGEHAFLLKEYVGALRGAGFLDVRVISPWHSPMNYAPYSVAELKAELARRASLGRPVLGRFWCTLFDAPGVWPMLRGVLERVDRRPGRLYSFVAVRA